MEIRLAHHRTKAHQRIIRDRQSHTEPSAAAAIEHAEVRRISYKEAKAIIEQYEWLGTMPGFVVRCFGIFFGDRCGGAVVYSTEYAENLGVWDKYGWTGKIICLSRGACVHWAHPHAASKLIRQSMKMLPARYKVVTCTVDGQAGEIGTIYQACGFHFVGQMSAGGDRASIITSVGKHISARTAYDLYGTRSIKRLREMGLTVRSVPRKSRYFAFIGTKKEKRDHRKAIEHLVKPYPKRSHRCQRYISVFIGRVRLTLDMPTLAEVIKELEEVESQVQAKEAEISELKTRGRDLYRTYQDMAAQIGSRFADEPEPVKTRRGGAGKSRGPRSTEATLRAAASRMVTSSKAAGKSRAEAKKAAEASIAKIQAKYNVKEVPSTVTEALDAALKEAYTHK